MKYSIQGIWDTPKRGGRLIKGVATLKIDPILRKRKAKKIRDSIMKHEMEEIKMRCLGLGEARSHKHAVSREAKVSRNVRGNTGMWKEFERLGLVIK